MSTPRPFTVTVVTVVTDVMFLTVPFNILIYLGLYFCFIKNS